VIISTLLTSAFLTEPGKEFRQGRIQGDSPPPASRKGKEKREKEKKERRGGGNE